MSDRAKRARTAPNTPRVLKLAYIVAPLAFLYLLLNGNLSPHELITGSVVLVLSTAFLIMVDRNEDMRLDLRWADIRTGWRLPWEILSDAWTITVVLFRDLFGMEPAGSYFRVSGFETARYDARMVARRALAVVYTTSTPNSIVIGIDYKQNRILAHQVRRSPVSEMTRDLGAKP